MAKTIIPGTATRTDGWRGHANVTAMATDGHRGRAEHVALDRRGHIVKDGSVPLIPIAKADSVVSQINAGSASGDSSNGAGGGGFWNWLFGG